MFDQVTVYVVWREGSERAPKLANTLWSWLNQIGEDGLPSPAGIPVYFRTLLQGGRVSPPIDAGEPGRSPLNLVLLLVDDLWMDDEAWCKVPSELAGRPDVSLFYVALHPNAPLSSDLLEDRQSIGVAGTPGEEGFPEAFRRAVTQAFANEVRDRGGIGKQRLKVFVSHSKRDGRKEAREIQKAIVEYGQLDCYFDERDIAWGSTDWAGQLRRAVEVGSAGMLVFETDVYASRPWCRAEVEMARTPVRGKPGTPDERVWWVVPTVVIGNPQGAWSKVLPELGNVARIGATGATADYARTALDRLVRDILLAGVNRLRARAVVRAHPEPAHALTWAPDPETLRHVRWEVGWTADLVYPGHGLYRFETQRLLKTDRSTERARPCLHTYADWTQRGPAAEPLRLAPGTLVAVSVSNSPDQGRLGFGTAHENATLNWWTTEIVRAGGRVVYGGILEEKDDKSGENKTAPIVAAVVEHARGRHAFDPFPKDAPLVNYQAFPFYRSVTVELRATLLRVVQFAFVDPPSWADAPPTAAEREALAADSKSEAWTVAAATALRRMRALMASGCAVEGHRVVDGGSTTIGPTRLRVAIGGKYANYLGVLPGIAEEYLEDRAAGLPALALAKYGGCAGLIATFLLGPADADLPRELTWAWASKQPFYKGVVAVAGQLGAEARWQELADRLRADRATLAAGTSLVPGLSADRLRALMVSESDGAILHAVLATLVA